MEAGSEADSAERPMTEEGTPEDSGETIKIPKEMLQGQSFKEGQEITMKVIAADDEGIEVTFDKPEEAEPMEGASRGADANSQIDQLNDGY